MTAATLSQRITQQVRNRTPHLARALTSGKFRVIRTAHHGKFPVGEVIQRADLYYGPRGTILTLTTPYDQFRLVDPDLSFAKGPEGQDLIRIHLDWENELPGWISDEVLYLEPVGRWQTKRVRKAYERELATR